MCPRYDPSQAGVDIFEPESETPNDFVHCQ